nr:cupin domain-containing protein [Pseudoxanthomonas sp.]
MPESSAFVVREQDVETLESPTRKLWLIADASDCCGALGANRLRLETGAAGAKLHYHEKSSEAFYVLDGRLDMVIGNEKQVVEKGGFVVIPPRMPHAFSAAPESIADVLVILVPGVDRFGYFRSLPRLLRGDMDPAEREQIAARYDVHVVGD